MKFETLDSKMRKNEILFDQYVLPDNYIIVRLDGKGFTKLTKESLELEKPFDIRFHEAMIATTKHLLTVGFKVIYAYTQSDEISLLIDKDDNTFNRKVRKINSVLAGEASAYFSMYFNHLSVLDCRTISIPNVTMILDYFSWRQEDAHRNSLSAYCYWTLRKNGLAYNEATKEIENLSIANKNDLLFQNGINYNDLPSWQKRGVGIYFENVQKTGINPRDNTEIMFNRKEVVIINDLPIREVYREFLLKIIV
ncbi:tRNA(His)-5'-guanylyltransferase [Flavobacterium sp. 9AF]|uniref:tRNA(His) guanylyltransferase Thg1 family protein n=1 Tax=Flavobacterium sp. 9AF TaxID=2653142 RepID=UPI0012F36EB5|nr:tRNA(His) guanylyltransferase Thg1 family protein [Flavobacterium sp. 9AF]VXB84372.1 tRNA(His)-5'-guanylyltransferase [Flavobacterium sp. 9AF]